MGKELFTELELPTGASAFEIAQAEGFTGTEAEWLASLHGQDGTDGTDGVDGGQGEPGADAYEVAVENGYTGTRTQWLASLVGAQGPAPTSQNVGAVLTVAGPAQTASTDIAKSAIAADRGRRPSVPQFLYGVFPSRLSRWHTAVLAVLTGVRDAKLFLGGDSTMDGFGGGSAATFLKANSWPSKMVPTLDRVLAPTAHGLAIPPSNSSAVTAPYDSRWTLGSGWTWRGTGTTDGFIGVAGKGTNVKGGGTGTLTFSDPRVKADMFDVWILVNNGGTGATYSMQATGGAPVTGQTFSQPASKLVKVTLQAGSAATSNVVSITRTGGTGAMYVVGIEPYLSTVRKIRVANAGVSGSDTTGWVTPPAQGAPWHSIGFIEEYAPDLSIFDLGINNANPASLISVTQTIADMSQLITAAQKSGDVMLKSMIPSDSTRYAHEALIVQALRDLGLPMVDVFAYYGSWQAALMVDGLHGNEAMYADEADYMAGVLYANRPVTSGPYVPPVAPAYSQVPGYNRRFLAETLTGADGASVASWPDITGSGTALTPAGMSGANTAPVIATYGGRKVVDFNGTTHGLGQDLAMNQPHTLVIVGRLTAIGGGAVQGISGSTGTAGSRANVYIDGTAGNAIKVNAGSTLTAGAADTALHVWVVVFDGTTVVSVDGAEVSGAAGTNPRTKFTLGGIDGTNRAAIQVLEAMTYPSALDATQRANVISLAKAHHAF